MNTLKEQTDINKKMEIFCSNCSYYSVCSGLNDGIFHKYI